VKERPLADFADVRRLGGGRVDEGCRGPFFCRCKRVLGRSTDAVGRWKCFVFGVMRLVGMVREGS